MTIAVVFSATDILSARFLTSLSDKDQRWRIAAKFFPSLVF
jgi:hypothetical protein